jgi:hypothetical protein
MVRKARGRAAVLRTIPDNIEELMPATATKDAEGVIDVLQLIDNIELQSK